jgi:hypothetical protein
MIDGLLAPIFDSKIASADKVRIAGDGSGARSEPSQRPLVTVRPLGQIAELSAQERAEYTRSTGQAAQSRAIGKVVDILA